MDGAKNHAESCGSSSCHQREACRPDGGVSSDGIERGSGRSRIDPSIATLVDHLHGCDDLVHIDARWLGRDDVLLDTGRAVYADTQFSPVRKERSATPERGAEAAHGHHGLFGSLAILKQELGGRREEIQVACGAHADPSDHWRRRALPSWSGRRYDRTPPP